MIRTFFTSVSVLLCCILFTGAVGFDAPVMPSKDFYVNDHAGVIGQQERDAMLETAREIYEATGVRTVVLTIESFDEFSPAGYAEKIFDSWGLGEAHGAIGSKGILVLFCAEERHIVARTNTDLDITDSIETAELIAAGGEFSEAVSVCFFTIEENIYGKNKINGGAEAVFIEPERIPSDAWKEPVKKAQEAEGEKERSDASYFIMTAAITAVIILYAGMTHRKIKRLNWENSTYNGTYYRTEYTSLTERIDDDDYPSGFGGLGNRKAIYGEDVDEADDVGIIKRDENSR